MDPEHRIPTFEIEDAGTKPAGSNDLDAALAEARERGVSRAVEILSGREMLSAAEFAKFIGVSREAVRGKHQRHEVLELVSPEIVGGRCLHSPEQSAGFPVAVTPNAIPFPHQTTDCPSTYLLLSLQPL